MSYSFFEKCFNCKNGGDDYKSPCIDKVILSDAINTIHRVGNKRGHLGSGKITLDCANFEDKNVPVVGEVA